MVCCEARSRLPLARARRGRSHRSDLDENSPLVSRHTHLPVRVWYVPYACPEQSRSRDISRS
eukprot:scaffold109625_cov18-Prasinocladus_malaysianus.AAC.1